MKGGDNLGVSIEAPAPAESEAGAGPRGAKQTSLRGDGLKEWRRGLEKEAQAVNQSAVESLGEYSGTALNLSDWRPAEKATNCHICKRPFTTFLRKHHCRSCGEVICDTCSRFCPLEDPEDQPTSMGRGAARLVRRAVVTAKVRVCVRCRDNVEREDGSSKQCITFRAEEYSPGKLF